MNWHDLDCISRRDLEARVDCPICHSNAHRALVDVRLRETSALFVGVCRRCGLEWRGVWYAVPDVVRVIHRAA